MQFEIEIAFALTLSPARLNCRTYTHAPLRPSQWVSKTAW